MKLTTKNQDPKNYIEANFILHKIGEQLPYFSLTGRVVVNGVVETYGAIHEEIVAVFPELADAAALHLSDITGRPMHSFENGKYWAGFSQFGMANASSKFLAELWRIDQNEAAELMRDALMAKILADGHQLTPVGPEELLKEFHDRQIPRWNEEAKAAINKYKLQNIEIQ